MRITANKAIEILNLLGINDAELVDTKEEESFNEGEFLQSVDAARESIIRQKIEPEIRLDESKKVAGKIGGKFKQMLRDKTGIDMSEIKDLDDKEALELAISKLSVGQSKDIETIRSEFNKLVEDKAKEIDSIKAESAAAIGAEKKKFADRHVLDFIHSQLKDAPTPENADKAILAKDYKNHLESIYDFEYNEETNAVNVLDKATKAPALNKTATAPVSLIEEAQSFLSPRGLWVSDMRDSKAGEMTDKKGADYKKVEAPAQNSNRDKAAAMAEMMSGGR